MTAPSSLTMELFNAISSENARTDEKVLFVKKTLKEMDSESIDINAVFEGSSILREALEWAEDEPQYLHLLLRWKSLDVNKVISKDPEEKLTAAHYASIGGGAIPALGLICLLYDGRFDPRLLSETGIWADSKCGLFTLATGTPGEDYNHLLWAFYHNDKFALTETEVDDLKEMLSSKRLDKETRKILEYMSRKISKADGLASGTKRESEEGEEEERLTKKVKTEN